MITIKTPEEIAKMRQAGAIVARTLKYIEGEIKPGRKTKLIDKLAEEFIRSSGGIPSFKGYRGYKHATCLSINEQVVHGIPGDRELMPGDIIGVDTGAIYAGYHGDSACTFVVGEVSVEAQKLLDVTKAGLIAGLAQVKPGNKLGDVGYAIEQVAKQNGYSVVRDLFGHGIGQDLHEDPLIPNFGQKGQGPEIRQGMTFAIEPMFNCGTYKINTLPDGWTVVTADGKLSAHFEHTVVVNAEGCEILTKI